MSTLTVKQPIISQIAKLHIRTAKHATHGQHIAMARKIIYCHTACDAFFTGVGITILAIKRLAEYGWPSSTTNVTAELPTSALG
jgi:hypothetical protein